MRQPPFAGGMKFATQILHLCYPYSAKPKILNSIHNLNFLNILTLDQSYNTRGRIVPHLGAVYKLPKTKRGGRDVALGCVTPRHKG